MSIFRREISNADDIAYRKALAIPSPVNGKVLPLDEFPSALFQQRLFGEGVAVMPAGYQVLAPFAADVIHCPMTRHQVRLKADNGLQLLIQLGWQAELLMGYGLRSQLKEGQKVAAGELLIEFDLPKLKRELGSPLFAVTLINSQRLQGVQGHYRSVMAMQDPIMTLYV